jgi:hypothetical protein
VIRYLSTQLGPLPVELTRQAGGWCAALVDEHPSLSQIAPAVSADPYTALATLEQSIRSLSAPNAEGHAPSGLRSTS